MKYNDNGEYKDIYIKTFDTLPVGTEVDYDGVTVPDGWSEIPETNYYKKLLTTPVSANSSGVITQTIEDYTNYDFLLIEYSPSTTNAIQTMLLPTFTINSTKHFYPTLFQASNVYESIILTFPTTTQIKLEVDTNAGWGKPSLTLYTITGIKMNMIN